MSRKKFGMGGHQGVMESDVWLTPKYILDALGPFDLDPCANVTQPWPTANFHYTKEDDGLIQPWVGRIWLNPPYGRYTRDWLEKLAAHGVGTALIFARTDTVTWRDFVWSKASSILFLHGRIRFCKPDGKSYKGSGAPSALISYGVQDMLRLQSCKLPGQWVGLPNGQPPSAQRWLGQWVNRQKVTR